MKDTICKLFIYVKLLYAEINLRKGLSHWLNVITKTRRPISMFNKFVNTSLREHTETRSCGN